MATLGSGQQGGVGRMDGKAIERESIVRIVGWVSRSDNGNNTGKGPLMLLPLLSSALYNFYTIYAISLSLILNKAENKEAHGVADGWDVPSKARMLLEWQTK